MSCEWRVHVSIAGRRRQMRTQLIISNTQGKKFSSLNYVLCSSPKAALGVARAKTHPSANSTH
jgi:hypothetical protein